MLFNMVTPTSKEDTQFLTMTSVHPVLNILFNILLTITKGSLSLPNGMRKKGLNLASNFTQSHPILLSTVPFLCGFWTYKSHNHQYRLFCVVGLRVVRGDPHFSTEKCWSDPTCALHNWCTAPCMTNFLRSTKVPSNWMSTLQDKREKKPSCAIKLHS